MSRLLPRRLLPRRVLLGACAVVAVVLTGLVAMIVYGLTAEYGEGAVGSLALPVVVCLVPATLALGLWPAGSPRARVGWALADVLLVTLVMVGAQWAGAWSKEVRLEEASASFSCGAGVDSRVDDAFASLPRPVPIYGPVEGGPGLCVAGISGGEGSLDEFRAALHGSAWSVVRDEPTRVVARRGGLLATAYLEVGSRVGDRQPLLRVELAR
jgi:hypothetical protein